VKQFLLLHNCRVRSSGKVEDCGDFSDFYIPAAAHMTEEQKRQFQQLQDEVSQQANFLQRYIIDAVVIKLIAYRLNNNV